MNNSQFGYYQVGQHNFYSKLEAIEMMAKTGKHVEWNFNDSVYNSYNWKIEPKETLAELYKRRAEQIREKYDYIVLWYSSGADSDNVLTSFIDNDIKIDELASFVNYKYNPSKDTIQMNGEVFNIAIPKFERYKSIHPDLKFRLVDMCEHTLEYFQDNVNMLDWHYSQNMIFNPNATMRSRLFQKISEWTKIKDSGKKIVFVWGVDKPRLNLDEKTNKYYFNFIDYIDNTMNAKWQSENIEGDFVEFFYWSPDLPEIPIKQSHIVKNYLRNSNKCSQFLSKFKKNTLGYAQIDNEKYYISNVGVNFLIYPKYNYNILNEWKPANIFLTERDTWFFNLSKNEKAFTNWESSVTALWKKLPSYWKNDPNDFSKSIKASVSRPYYIE